MKLKFMLAILCLFAATQTAYATPQQAWQEAMFLAQQGNDQQSIALMRGAQLQYGKEHIWSQRFALATRLLEIRNQAKHRSHYKNPDLQARSNHEIMLAAWLKQHPKPEYSGSVVPGLLSSILPGAGHAWLGRWGDAGVAAMLVWPLLILTFWAARRDMGPVTVFFALITAWLWSGTVFSAVSLAERGDYEQWYHWWQQMWSASGLPSRPW